LFARSGEKLKDAKEQLDALALPGTVKVAVGDVRVEDDVRRAVHDAAGPEKRLDGLIATAGLSRQELLIGTDYEDWRRVMDININGVFLAVKESARLMVKQGS